MALTPALTPAPTTHAPALTAEQRSALADATRTHALHWLALAATFAAGVALSAILPWGFAA